MGNKQTNKVCKCNHGAESLRSWQSLSYSSGYWSRSPRV